MSDVAIRAEGLGKRYRIGASLENRYPTLRDRIAGALTAPWRRIRKLVSGQATGAADLDETVWALRDVSFEVRRGEVVGVIGRNGAGKTTLLKILSRITEPTEGYAELHGRVGSLLEVGTGFHPELSGRENIYLNGAILGMTRDEIERKFDEIVDFAGIRKFIDTPVKHYSTGMYVRLAFAVAAHLETEILLVDEVLSVGDAAFQRKCLGRMTEVAGAGRTVLFVSHNMAAVNRLCERAIWIDEGRIRLTGHPGTVISEYLASDASLGGSARWEDGVSDRGVDDFQFDAVTLRSPGGEIVGEVGVDEPFVVEIEFTVLAPLPVSRVGFLLRTADAITVFDAYDSDDERFAARREPGRYLASCMIPGKLLNPGRYYLSLNAGIPGQRSLAHVESALSIDVVDTGAVGSHMTGGREGIILPELEWRREELRPASRTA